MNVALTAGWLAATAIAYGAGLAIRRATGGHPLANPTAIAIFFVGACVVATHTPYAVYVSATWPLAFMLAPATVALGVPLARHLHAVRRDLVAIVVASVFGAVSSMASGVAIVRLLGGDVASALSILPKAATTPIATAIALEVGGRPSLAATLAIAGGILAAIVMSATIAALGSRDWRAIGLAAGTAGSGVAAAQVAPHDETAAAFAAVGIGLCGIVTAAVAPLAAHAIR